MNINIGGRPIGKVLLSFFGSLAVVVVVTILAAGPSVIEFSADEWVAFLFAAIAPPAIAFFKSITPKDALQILQSIPPETLDQYLVASGAKAKLDDLKKFNPPDSPY